MGATFLGYVRPDGKVGVRNHVVVIPSVACVNGVVANIAKMVPEVVPIFHGHGCGRSLEASLHTKVLAHLGKNPNVAAVLVVGLGCEVIKADSLASIIATSGKPVQWFNVQEKGGSRKAAEKGAEICRHFLSIAKSCPRTPCQVDKLTIGLECGGSDAFSGVTANPAVGIASDWIVDEGGTVILTEDTEMIGTSHILASRAIDEEVKAKTVEMVAEAEQLTKDLLGPLASLVIAPGNMDGGMSTIQEKSLGCITKAGSRPIVEVVGYGEPPSRPGVVLMDGPGYDAESLPGLAAAGSQIIVFTTGRGTPLGFPICPVIKVASNSRLFTSMRDDMDVNAGEVLEGRELSEVGQEIIRLITEVASGQPTRAEANAQGGIVCLYTLHPPF
ncbi:MAG TPA: UxaA family hydrolase [Syntrophales bacterium]|nr:UxaA family hydrolase [Syntrophales bacterium]HOL58370.1 UxaA family hydrolase [Syntrophales bacterium]HPO34539.1 UxaA family hydrolase [Syntrophales bacterium]